MDERHRAFPPDAEGCSQPQRDIGQEEKRGQDMDGDNCRCRRDEQAGRRDQEHDRQRKTVPGAGAVFGGSGGHLVCEPEPGFFAQCLPQPRNRRLAQNRRNRERDPHVLAASPREQLLRDDWRIGRRRGDGMDGAVLQPAPGRRRTQRFVDRLRIALQDLRDLLRRNEPAPGMVGKRAVIGVLGDQAVGEQFAGAGCAVADREPARTGQLGGGIGVFGEKGDRIAVAILIGCRLCGALSGEGAQKLDPAGDRFVPHERIRSCLR